MATIFKNNLIILILLTYVTGILVVKNLYGAIIIFSAFIISTCYLYVKKKRQYIYLCILFAMILCFATLKTYLKQRNDNALSEIKKIYNFTGSIASAVEYENNRYKFEFRTKIGNRKYVFLSTWKTKNKSYIPKYGDIIKLYGQCKEPAPPTNPGQFNYIKYLKQKGYAGVLKVKQITIIRNSFANPFKRLAFYLKKKILAINNKTLPYPYSDLYTGLVFGDHGTKLPDEMSENFQKVGLMHLLVVSGSQVALLSGILLTIFRTLKLRPKWTYIAITLCNILFYFITGGGASIFRAILMSQIALAIKLLKRNADVYHIMALTAVIMLLINPLNLFNLGAQLSFIATFALLFGVPKMAALFPASWPKYISETLSLSITPFILTTPLVWYAFNNISPVSILSNLIVINWIELLVVVGFFSTVVGFVFLPVTQIINNFSLLLMIVLNKLVDFLTSLPFGIIYVSKPNIIIILGIYGIVLFMFRSLEKKYYKQFKIASLGFLILVFFLVLPGLLPRKYLKVTFLDVGQGDSILIECPNRKVVLIDGGDIIRDFRTGEVVFDTGKRVIMPVLRYKGINKIDAVITSHFHSDHIGGIPYLLSQIPVGVAIDNGQYVRKFNNYYQIIEANKIDRIIARGNQKIKLGKDLTLNILSYSKQRPNNENNYFNDNENNNSVACRLSYKEMDFLFTGDLEHDKENELAANYGSEIRSEVLKLGHHGSNTSSSLEFMNKVNPVYGTISVGNKNKFRHPSKSIISRLKNNNIQILRTDHHGAVEFITDGHKLFYKKYK